MTSSSPDLDALLTWIRTESPTHDRAGVNLMMDLVAAQMQDAPVAVERIPGTDGLGDVLVLRAGPQTDEPGILVMSHLDTVHPVGTLESDLPLRIEGDRLYGPGVYDMKGGAWFCLEAFKDVARKGTAARPLVFLVTPDEEIGSPITRPMIEDLRPPLGLRPRYRTGPRRRPDRHRPQGGGALRGACGRTAGPCGLAPQGWAQRRLRGRPPDPRHRGDDGLFARDHHERRPDRRRHGGEHRSPALPLPRGSAGRDGGRRQGLDGGILGLKPSHPDFKVTVTGGMNRPPYERTEATSKLFDHARSLAAEIGFDLVSAPRVGGGSDGNFTAALGIPTLDGLGIDGDGAHTLQEYGLISSIAPRQKLMTRLLETLALSVTLSRRRPHQRQHSRR